MVLMRRPRRIGTRGEGLKPQGAAKATRSNKETNSMRMIPVFLVAVACLALAVPAAAIECGGCGTCSTCCQQSCCDPCCDAGCGQGCCDPCGGCCMVVCETKTVKKVIWRCECKPFCLPLPSCCKGCTQCVDCCAQCGGCGCDACGGTACGSCGGCGCSDCGSCGGCGVIHKVHVQAQPRCGNVRTKKVLYRGYCEIEVPVYKCVVTCGGNGCCGDPGCCDPGCGGGCGCGGGEVIIGGAAPVPAPEAQAADLAPLPPM